MKRAFIEKGTRRHNGVAQREWDRVGAARRDADREAVEAKDVEESIATTSVARFEGLMEEHRRVLEAAEGWHTAHPEWLAANPEPDFNPEEPWIQWRSRWYLAAQGG
jgi:hypothetical protein